MPWLEGVLGAGSSPCKPQGTSGAYGELSQPVSVCNQQGVAGML